MTDDTKKDASVEEKKPEENKSVEKKTVNNTEKKEAVKKNDRKDRRSRRQQRRKEPKEFEEAILQIDRVTRVVAGGRRLRFRVSVVIGNQKGRVGFGIGKAGEVMIAIQKAVAQAKRSLINVPIFEGTIPHEANSTFKSSRVLLFPAPEGKGVIAGGAVRKILELAGVKDVLSKVHGSRNKINIAVATLKAIETLQNKPPYKKEDKETLESKPKEKTKNNDKKTKKEVSSKK